MESSRGHTFIVDDTLANLDVLRDMRAMHGFQKIWILCLSLVMMVFFVLPTNAQNPKLRFEHLGQDQGLSESTVEAILEDHNGFMWFGTNDGLNRYDGNTFSIYRNDPQDPRSLSGNRISVRGLLEDHEGILWVGTLGEGLNRYDRDSDTFQWYKRDEQDPSSLSSNVVYVLYEDRDGELWIGTSHGLNRFDRATETFVRYLPQEQDPARGLSAPDVFAILQDRQGYMWIGTQGGASIGWIQRPAPTSTSFMIATILRVSVTIPSGRYGRIATGRCGWAPKMGSTCSTGRRTPLCASSMMWTIR